MYTLLSFVIFPLNYLMLGIINLSQILISFKIYFQAYLCLEILKN